VLAMVVGWARWLELRLPAARRRVPGSIWAVVPASPVLTESVLTFVHFRASARAVG